MNKKKSFVSKIAGVTQKNRNGSDRQGPISKLKKNDVLKLVREYDNPEDENAIAVYNKKDQQLGYLKKNVASKLSTYIDQGGVVSATVNNVHGGKDIPAPNLFKFKPIGKEPYECVIKITQEDNPLISKQDEAKNLIAKAKALETTQKSYAISLYEDALRLLNEVVHSCHRKRNKEIIEECNKQIAFAVNTASLLLEQEKIFSRSLFIINMFMPDTDNSYSRIVSNRRKQLESKPRNGERSLPEQFFRVTCQTFKSNGVQLETTVANNLNKKEAAKLAFEKNKSSRCVYPMGEKDALDIYYVDNGKRAVSENNIRKMESFKVICQTLRSDGESTHEIFKKGLSKKEAALFCFEKNKSNNHIYSSAGKSAFDVYFVMEESK